MDETRPNSGASLPRTLDELIEAGDARALADAAAQSEGIRRQIEIQNRIDDSLRRLFAEPRELSIGATRRSPVRRWAVFAAAAALLLACVGAWRMWVVSNRPDLLGPVYHRLVDAGFKPDSVCTTDEEFAAWCRTYLRQPLYPSSRPKGLEYVGWSTGPVLGPVSAILLARVEGQPVVVVLERSDRQTAYAGRIEDPQLHGFRRRIAGIVLHEVTPLNRPTILPVISAQPSK